MPIQMMVPPGDGSRNIVSFKGRTYSSKPGVAVAVPDFDVPVLEASKWTIEVQSSSAGTPGESIYSKIRRLAARARRSNPRVLPDMQVPPAVTTSITTAPAAQTRTYQYTTNPAPFRILGGNPVVTAVDYVQAWCLTRTGTGAGSILPDPARDAVAWRMEFMTDSVAPVVVLRNLVNAPYRFIVDGQYVSRTATVAPGGTAGGPFYVTLDFSSAGGRARRHIAVEIEQSFAFRGVNVRPDESVDPALAMDLLRMTIGGDSITAGTGAPYLSDTWAWGLADCLGIRDMWPVGSGGTGYISTLGGTRYNLRQHIQDLTDPNPDLVAFAMGINDSASPVASIRTECGLCIDAVRAVEPTVPLFVFGVFKGTVALATIQAIEANLKSLVDARGDSNLFFVPITGTGSAGDSPVIFGTGRVGAPAGNGNSDIYTSADGTHPVRDGHTRIATQMADNLLAAIAGKA